MREGCLRNNTLRVHGERWEPQFSEMRSLLVSHLCPHPCVYARESVYSLLAGIDVRIVLPDVDHPNGNPETI